MSKILPIRHYLLIKVIKDEQEKIKNGLIVSNSKGTKRMIIDSIGPECPGKYKVGTEILFLRDEYVHNYFEDEQEYWLIEPHYITAVIVNQTDEIKDAEGC